MQELIIRVVTIVLVFASAGRLRVALRKKEKTASLDGGIRKPDLAPVILYAAAFFTLAMLWVFSMNVFDGTYAPVTAIIIVCCIDLLMLLLSLPYIFWYVKPLDDELEVRTGFGRVEHYPYKDMTHAIRGSDGGLVICKGDKRQLKLDGNLELGTVEEKLVKNGIQIRSFKNVGALKVHQTYFLTGITALACLLFGFFVFYTIIKEPVSPALFVSLVGLALITLYSTLHSIFDTTVINGSTIEQKGLFKRKRIIRIEQLAGMRLQHLRDKEILHLIMWDQMSEEAKVCMSIKMWHVNAPLLLSILKDKGVKTIL